MLKYDINYKYSKLCFLVMFKSFAHAIVIGDPMTQFYKFIDFDRAVIGGSYALNQYTQDYMWSPDDVDIMTTATNIEHFRQIAESFATSANGTLIRFNDFSEGHPNDDPEQNRRDEKFHESIKASAKILVHNLKHPIQYVWIQGLTPDNGCSPEAWLEEITDLPACVNYKVDPITQKKHFNVPEKAKECLMTRHIHSTDICPSRKEKYEKRGYKFID